MEESLFSNFFSGSSASHRKKIIKNQINVFERGENLQELILEHFNFHKKDNGIVNPTLSL